MDAAGPLTRVWRSAWTGALVFLALTLVVTWPLGARIGRAVPSDYGDPLYAAWALAWVSRQLGRILTGDLQALVHFFDANQLHPEPATLALSDHFVGQALPLAPVYWISGNPLLTLDLAYLTAFWLLGFSAWLLARELTGSGLAGVLAGAIFAFNEFLMVYELPHLQMLSAHWMPLTLFGLRRYFAHGERTGLAVASASVVLLNLSAGYYMLMFPPFTALYVAWELTTRRRWAHAATWRDLLGAALPAAVCTAPFVWPYMQAQQRLGMQRSLEETAQMAATIDGYIDAGWRLGAVYACAVVAIAGWAVMLVRRGRTPPLMGFVIAGLLLSFWLSLGPSPRWGTLEYELPGVYRLVQAFLPGMSAIRVTSRYGVVFLLFLSMLAAFGASTVARLRVIGPAAVLACAASVIAWSAPRPFPLDRHSSSVEVRDPAPYLTPAGRPPAVYRYLASLPPPAVVAELPFIDLWYNTRYLFFSTFHWHPLVNGFTSFFPPAYIERVRWLVDPVRTPDEAWKALRSGRTTHVVLHTGAWDAEYVAALRAWLLARGARSHGAFDLAEIFELPPAGGP